MKYERPIIELLTLTDEDIISTSETAIFETEDDENIL